MRLFTDAVDRYCVGKLIAGLLFIGSFGKLVHVIRVESPVETVVVWAVACVLWVVLFKLIESRRRTLHGAD